MQDGKLLPAALAAKECGIVFDVGHGGGSFDYTICEPVMAQGCPPDTISSDIHVFSGNSPGMPNLTWVTSRFLGLGFTLEQVVAMATVNLWCGWGMSGVLDAVRVFKPAGEAIGHSALPGRCANVCFGGGFCLAATYDCCSEDDGPSSC